MLKNNSCKDVQTTLNKREISFFYKKKKLNTEYRKAMTQFGIYF